MDELSPLTVSREYKIQWKKPKTDLTELARLRWIKKWSVGHLAKAMDRSPETIRKYLRQMKKPGGLDKVNLSLDELEIVRVNINQRFRGL